MRIYLIGFMASGKSTLGRRAADAFGVAFYDTDTVIEAQTGISIHEVFDRYGEPWFRQIEADVLRQSMVYEVSVNATGGGLPCFEDNMAWMNSNGITIYLEWPDDVITKHLERLRSSRPLLSGPDEAEAKIRIKDLLTLRKPVYEQAAITLEMAGEMEKDYARVERACRYVW